MTYTPQSRILTTGAATATQIQTWFIERGKQMAPSFAPDGKYKSPPADLGQIIIEEARHWPGHVVNHDLLAAQISHECAAWQSKYARERNNPSGLGAVNNNPDNAIHFPSPRDGVRATVAHLLTYVIGPGAWTEHDPRASATPAGWQGTVRVLEDLEGKWAYPGDGYADALAKLANILLDVKDTPSMPDKPRIALSAGHHNSDGGGTPGEHQHTGTLTREIAHRAQASGLFDVHIITPGDGLGDHPGGLSDAARVAVSIGADLFLEVHFEGNGAGNAGRGSFAIYPDWDDDVDVDVRDRLGPDMAIRMQAATGIPKRGVGTMSEKSTGVGSQGFRLGVFGATAPARATMTRLIYEYGALTAPADRAIIDGPEFNRRAAGATVDAIAAFYGVAQMPEQQPELVIAGNPFGDIKIVHGFRDTFLGHGKLKFASDPISGGVSLFGFPKGDERATDFGSEQQFERVTMRWQKGVEPPFDIVLALPDVPEDDDSELEAQLAALQARLSTVDDVAAAIDAQLAKLRAA